MTRFDTIAAGLLGLMFSTAAWAQSELAEIVVTGSRINGDDYSKIPAVTIDKRADFLVQEVRVTNDTRAEKDRTKEIYQTIRDLLADAAKQKGIAFGYGDDFLIPITANDYEIPLGKEGGRPDTSTTQFYVKLAIGPNDDVKSALARLKEFIAKARVTGRTELKPDGDEALSIVNPERYRFEIISQIAADAKKLQVTIGQQCKVDISGLSSRVSWMRSDISQLTLYIPYEVQLSDCQ
jgi:hypothetical protein